MNGPLKFLTARKILPLLDLLAKFQRVIACSCSPNFCVALKLAKQIFLFLLVLPKNRIARHARECSQRPFVTPQITANVSQIPHLHYFTQICVKAKTDIALDLLSVAMTVNATFAQDLHLGAKIIGSHGFKGHLLMVCTLCK